MKTIISLVVLVVAGLACSSEPTITKDMLDGGTLFDPSLYNPGKYLVSKATPNPTAEQARKPVIIACHGYSATTFEWDEFRTWANGRTDFQLSQVLLGGHGRSYEDFKKSTWQDWQLAIKDEYEQLVKAGYTNISLLGSSTSGALLLELVSSGYFNNRLVPRNLLLVDPIVIPSDKTLSLIGVVGPMLGYIETEQSAEEDKVYYHFRPQETLQQLQKLLTVVRQDLESGIRIPPACTLKVYKSKKDPTADPVSAVLIDKGTKTADGKPIDVALIDSDLHVYTRLTLRSQVTPKDQQNQTETFADIVGRVVR
ncbi:alpha/beta hydrolase [Spirosoma utsteinense]|uniref:Carboxylesterase n=1 Tax=Spirosoma utsteinense TaxID=2585773 RepID=A0ABR6W719_9BACT|nr:esterase [Spirosoma utsteinense]MBC3786173.1 carboxylesterase [Spirosoma utsteinense]MBC3792363.1 carboxylesterase [Spirosoma utsteinense]